MAHYLRQTVPFQARHRVEPSPVHRIPPTQATPDDVVIVPVVLVRDCLDNCYKLGYFNNSTRLNDFVTVSIPTSLAYIRMLRHQCMLTYCTTNESLWIDGRAYSPPGSKRVSQN